MPWALSAAAGPASVVTPVGRTASTTGMMLAATDQLRPPVPAGPALLPVRRPTSCRAWRPASFGRPAPAGARTNLPPLPLGKRCIEVQRDGVCVGPKLGDDFNALPHQA